MNLKFLSFLLLILILVGCKSKNAYDYNQYLVKEENSLTKDIELTENKVREYSSAGLYDSISVVSLRMKKILQGKIEEIQKKPAPKAKEAEKFKEAYIDYFRFMQDVYEAYEDYGSQTTDNGRQESSQRLVMITSKKEQVISKLQEVQKKYAEANGFRIEK